MLKKDQLIAYLERLKCAVEEDVKRRNEVGMERSISARRAEIIQVYEILVRELLKDVK